MEHHKVDSKNIESIAHDPDSGIMEVKFKGSGKTYEYQGVTAAAHKAFMDAKSKGVHHMKLIRGKFLYRVKGEKTWRK